MTQLVKPLTWIFGVVFVVIGVLGFVNDPILGIFEVNSVHNIVHLLSGVVALGAAASGYQYSRLYLMIFGIVYALVTVLGFISTNGTVLGLITINAADNYLHLIISLASLIVGFGSSKVMAPGMIKSV